jgi:hypothetical protein
VDPFKVQIIVHVLDSCVGMILGLAAARRYEVKKKSMTGDQKGPSPDRKGQAI